MPHTFVNDLVDERCGEFFFGKIFVQVMKVSADKDGALFLENRNRVGNPRGVFNGIYKMSLLELIDFSFDNLSSRGIDGSQILTNMIGIEPCIDMVLENGRDIGHVSFFEIILCRNGISKPIDFIMDEVFRLHSILVM